MCLLMHICYSKIHFHQLGPLKLIKTMFKSLNVLQGVSPMRGSRNFRQGGPGQSFFFIFLFFF